MTTFGLDRANRLILGIVSSFDDMPYPCVTCGREISMNAAVCPGCGEINAGEQAMAPYHRRRSPSPQIKIKVQPDSVLAAIIGPGPLLSSEVSQRVWNYVKSNSLQDPQKPTIIIADEKLLPLFDGKERVTMFEMSKFAYPAALTR